MGNVVKWEIGSIIKNEDIKNGNKNGGGDISIKDCFFCPNFLQMKPFKKQHC